MTNLQEADRLVAEVVAAAGGQIVGRVRLQKIFYLLDRVGLESGFDYEYHYYGPYSSGLAEAVEDATAFGGIDERIGRRSYDGVSYSIFETTWNSPKQYLGSLSYEPAATALRRMQTEPATALELAATIDWLRTQEQVSDWRAELVRRKGAKAERSRVDRAERLLQDLHLDNC
jgi:uncharacterized protein YwgA